MRKAKPQIPRTQHLVDYIKRHEDLNAYLKITSAAFSILKKDVKAGVLIELPPKRTRWRLTASHLSDSAIVRTEAIGVNLALVFTTASYELYLKKLRLELVGLQTFAGCGSATRLCKLLAETCTQNEASVDTEDNDVSGDMYDGGDVNDDGDVDENGDVDDDVDSGRGFLSQISLFRHLVVSNMGLTPLAELFRVARNCIAHQDGLVNKTFRREYRSPEVMKSIRALQSKLKMKKTLPGISDMVKRGRIELDPEHVIMASDVYRRIIGEIDARVCAVLGPDLLLRASLRHLDHGRWLKVQDPSLSWERAAQEIQLGLLRRYGLDLEYQFLEGFFARNNLMTEARQAAEDAALCCPR